MPSSKVSFAAHSSGRKLRRVPGQEPLGIRVELGQERLGAGRQSGIGPVEGPAGELGPDTAVIFGMIPAEIDEQAEDPLELEPRDLPHGPVQLFPVGEHPLAERVEPALAQAGRGDELDGFLVEERQPGLHERRQGPAVFRVGLVEEEDPVSRAADPFLGMAGQGFQPSADDGRGPQFGLAEEPLDPLQPFRRGPDAAEEGQGDEPMDLLEVPVRDPPGFRDVLRGESLGPARKAERRRPSTASSGTSQPSLQGLKRTRAGFPIQRRG